MATALPSRQEVVTGSLWSGLLATAIGHPLDCVKVRLQTAAASPSASAASSAARTTLGTARSMWKREGARAFTRGFLPPMLNSLTMNTVIFVGFEESKSKLHLAPPLAGAFAGLVGSFVGTPFDRIKILMQVGGSGGSGGRGTGTGTGTGTGLVGKIRKGLEPGAGKREGGLGGNRDGSGSGRGSGGDGGSGSGGGGDGDRGRGRGRGSGTGKGRGTYGSKSSNGSSGSNGTGSETGTRAGKGELRGNRGAPALKTSRPSPHLRPRVPFADLRRALSDAGGLRGLYAGHGMNVVREAVFGAIYLGGTVYWLYLFLVTGY